MSLFLPHSGDVRGACVLMYGQDPHSGVRQHSIQTCTLSLIFKLSNFLAWSKSNKKIFTGDFKWQLYKMNSFCNWDNSNEVLLVSKKKEGMKEF